MQISIVAALDKNWLIGDKGNIPWRIREDFRRFYKLTVGKTVVMGRSTLESIIESLGKPLPKRTNIVLTRNKDFNFSEGIICNDIEDVLMFARKNEVAELMIIGGASIYEQFLPLANKMYLTWIEHEFEGDTYFPEFNKEDWTILKEEQSVESGYKIRFQVLKKL